MEFKVKFLDATDRKKEISSGNYTHEEIMNILHSNIFCTKNDEEIDKLKLYKVTESIYNVDMKTFAIFIKPLRE
jgi:hypothetical protein